MNRIEWNGMEWNGMEWNGMEWNGMEYIEIQLNIIPIVPHKAVAEVSRIGNYRRDWLL